MNIPRNTCRTVHVACTMRYVQVMVRTVGLVLQVGNLCCVWRGAGGRDEGGPATQTNETD